MLYRVSDQNELIWPVTTINIISGSFLLNLLTRGFTAVFKFLYMKANHWNLKIFSYEEELIEIPW